MLRKSIVNSWLCRAAALLLGTSVTFVAWAGNTAVTIGNGNTTVTGGPTVIYFPVTRTGDLSYPLFLNYQTQDGTAVAGTDYTAAQGFWLLPAGQANVTIPVAVNGNNTALPDKTFALNLIGMSTLSPYLTFGSAETYIATQANQMIILADVNGGGRPDLIRGSDDQSAVTGVVGWTNNTPRGTNVAIFSTSAIGGLTGFGPKWIVVADMNGDGKPDIISSNSSSSVSVILNGMTAPENPPVFSAPQTFPITAAGSIAAADFNGDGKPDLVVGSSGNTVTLLLNATATDSFTVNLLQQVLAVGNNANSMYVAAADLDGDGKPDLIVTDPTLNTLSVLQNATPAGAQSATFGTPLVLGTGAAPMQCVVADVNGDGKPDLIVANSGDNTLSVFLNTTTAGNPPSFASPLVFSVAGSPVSLAVADMDGDGRPDLVVGYYSKTLGASVLLNMSTAGSTSFAIQPTLPTISTVAVAHFVATGDINGDGMPDLVITDLAQNGQAPDYIVFLNATTPGTPASVELSSTSLSFGDESVGGTSVAQRITLVNGGTAVLDNIAITATGPYVETDNCGTSVVGKGSCTINVSFAPTATGTQTGAITITDNAADSPQAVSLSGNGITATATLSTASLTFGYQAVGTTSTAQSVTLTNSGTAALSLSNIKVTGPYAQTNTCGSSVGAGASCTFSVTFAPTAMGSQPGTITLTDNAVDSPQTISLSGTGAVATAILSYTNIEFGDVTMGTTSGPQLITLNNTGNVPLTVSIAYSGLPYTESNGCNGLVAAGGSCTISVYFTPTVPGNVLGTITLTDNAAGGTQTINLQGAGYGPAVSLSPVSLSFGNQSVGTTSAAQTVTVTNSGNAILVLNGIVASSSYSQTSNCGNSLPAGAICTISVVFGPTAVGDMPGTITLSDSASGSSQVVSLSGAGTGQAIVTLSATSLSFGNESVGTTSAAQTVTLTNNGNVALNLSSIAPPTGPYAILTNNCGSTEAAGASCTFSVTFTPTAIGSQPGSITLTDDATGSPQTISLSGTGANETASPSPASLSFGNQSVGTTSAAQTVTLTNNGALPSSLSSVVASGPYAISTNTCGSSVAANGGSCTISVTFAPTAFGTQTGTVVFTDSSANSPQTVNLSGTGTGATATLSATSLAFGNQTVSSTSAAQTVTVTNNGNMTLSVSFSTIGPYAETDNCGGSVAAGANCTVSVTFSPTAMNSQPGTLNVNNNTSGALQTVSLSGYGIEAIASLSPTSLAFGKQSLNTTSAVKTVRVTNTGNTPMSLSVSASATYAESDNCTTSSIAPQAYCTISVTYTPTAVGTPPPGMLNVQNNTSGAIEVASLTGTGVQAVPSVSPTSHNFGSVLDGTAGTAPFKFTVSNGSTATANFTVGTVSMGPGNPGQYVLSSDSCSGTVLAPGGSCTVYVAFKPDQPNGQYSSLKVPGTDPYSGVYALDAPTPGTGTYAIPINSPKSQGFGTVVVGAHSIPKVITLSNSTGTGPVTISSYSVTGGPFSSTTTCPIAPSTLAGGASCTFTLTYNASAIGTQTGTLSMYVNYTSNGANGGNNWTETLTTSLSGTGETNQ